MTFIYSRMTLKNRFCLREKTGLNNLILEMTAMTRRGPKKSWGPRPFASVSVSQTLASNQNLLPACICNLQQHDKSNNNKPTGTMKGGNAVLALLLALSTQYASAVTFQFVAEFNENCTASTIDQVAASNDVILAPFFESPEGAGYVFVEPGGVAEDTTNQTTDDVQGDSGSVRHRELLDCPSKCSNSNSNTCRLLGCAKCGDSCDRRLWQAVSSPHYRYWSKSRASGVTSKINPTFHKYLGRGGSRDKSCKARLSIYQINADGSTTLLN
jgi:hypothetical protein